MNALKHALLTVVITVVSVVSVLAQDAPTVELEETNWILRAFLLDDEWIEALSNTDITINFANGQISGSAGCNSIMGEYESDGLNFSIPMVGSTLMACEDSVSEQENNFLDALTTATRISQKENTLFIHYGDNATLMLEQQQPIDKVGVTWMWERFDDTADTNNIVIDDPSLYTLLLNSDGTYEVKADCNLASGRYTLDDSLISFESGPTTLAECGPKSLYNTYLTRLAEVATFVMDGDYLVLNLWADAGNMVFSTDHDVEQSDPPALHILRGDIAFPMDMGSYCWVAGDNGICVDMLPPMYATEIHVPVIGDTLELLFDEPFPNTVTVALHPGNNMMTQVSNIMAEAILDKNGRILVTVPNDLSGDYVLMVSATWEEANIPHGDAFYTTLVHFGQ